MNISLGMDVTQSKATEFDEPFDARLYGDEIGLDELFDIGSFEQLHHEVAVFLLLENDFPELDDVGMIEPFQDQGFVLERFVVVPIFKSLRENHLDRDFFGASLLNPFPDLSRLPGCDAALKPVFTERETCI